MKEMLYGSLWGVCMGLLGIGLGMGMYVLFPVFEHYHDQIEAYMEGESMYLLKRLAKRWPMP